VDADALHNLYKLNDSLYRSEQPDKEAMRQLEQLGIMTVLNTRNRISDTRRIRGTSLCPVHVPINAWQMSQDDLVMAMRALHRAQKPVLVHCLHGSDRTGAIIAAYRMIDEGWSREEAISEFREARFGYHHRWFPGILELLETLDIEEVRMKVGRVPGQN